MQSSGFHLAQMSISRARAALTEPSMQGFVDQLQYINQLADRTPGFVWRLQNDRGDATSFRAFDDPMILLNMSLWSSFEALYDYVYRSDHKEPFRDRRKWFEKVDGPVTALWWVPIGHVPTVLEGKERLELIRKLGPSEDAFDLQHPYPAPTNSASPAAQPSIVGDI